MIQCILAADDSFERAETFTGAIHAEAIAYAEAGNYGRTRLYTQGGLGRLVVAEPLDKFEAMYAAPMGLVPLTHLFDDLSETRRVLLNPAAVFYMREMTGSRGIGGDVIYTTVHLRNGSYKFGASQRDIDFGPTTLRLRESLSEVMAAFD